MRVPKIQGVSSTEDGAIESNTHDGSMGRTVYVYPHEWLIFLMGKCKVNITYMDPIG